MSMKDPGEAATSRGVTNHSASEVDVDEPTPTEKRCAKCGEVKRLAEFHRKRDTCDGLNGICKPCAREKSRAWSEANKERKAARSKIYREENAELLREKRRARWEANREVLLERQRLRYATNEAYRERQLKLVRAWIAANPDRMSEHYQKKRARRAAAQIGAVDVETLWTGSCGICGESMSADIPYPNPLSKSLDHIVPLARGGSHTQDNLQWAHLVCNTRKGARTA